MLVAIFAAGGSALADNSDMYAMVSSNNERLNLLEHLVSRIDERLNLLELGTVLGFAGTALFMYVQREEMQKQRKEDKDEMIIQMADMKTQNSKTYAMSVWAIFVPFIIRALPLLFKAASD